MSLSAEKEPGQECGHRPPAPSTLFIACVPPPLGIRMTQNCPPSMGTGRHCCFSVLGNKGVCAVVGAEKAHGWAPSDLGKGGPRPSLLAPGQLPPPRTVTRCPRYGGCSIHTLLLCCSPASAHGHDLPSSHFSQRLLKELGLLHNRRQRTPEDSQILQESSLLKQRNHTKSTQNVVIWNIPRQGN